jgi:sortase (surface protein transpeptidase)
MYKRSKVNRHHRKGKKQFLTFFKFQTLAFMISGLLIVIALSSAYSVYSEGRTAQKNAEQLLEQFEQVVLKTETNEPVNMNEEAVKSAEVQQLPSEPVEKPKVEYTPIAKLQAAKIGLSVSVLSEWSYQLLDISVNKFSGPEPNEPGNFIVIGHNYLNGAHFGSLHLLEVGDVIDLTDLSGRRLSYEIYEIL